MEEILLIKANAGKVSTPVRIDFAPTLTMLLSRKKGVTGANGKKGHYRTDRKEVKSRLLSFVG
jgi:hypothetical protein